jgi:3-phenylpropionate/trans-cinnamate dioxygenase ferredoxin reductase subunit
VTAGPRVSDVLIVGAGHAGTQVVAALRSSGHPGSVTVLSDEETLPYERPPLSKGYLTAAQTAEEIAFRPADWWSGAADLHLGRRVCAVDPVARTVETADGARFGYRALVWAAGGRARALPVSAAELPGVHTVRTLADATALRADLLPGTRLVVVGGGYIGLETAAAAVGLGLSVTVVETADRLLARVTGESVSRFYDTLHTDAGVTVLTGRRVVGLRGEQRVSAVELEDGTRLPADVVVVGVGLVPATEVLERAGARVDGGVLVDAQCRTDLPSVFAIGDCTRRSHPHAGPVPARIESVANATEQAKIVAAVLTERATPAPSVPWFWSHQYDVMLRTVGVRHPADVEVVRGDPASGRFTVCYLRNGVLVALDCVDRPADFAQGKALVARGARVSPESLADPAVSLKQAADISETAA